MNIKAKLALLALLTITVCSTGYAQVSVGKSKTGSLKKLKKDDFALIKSKTTIFVVDDFTLEEIEGVAKEVWTVNPYKVITREDFVKHKKDYVIEQNAIWEVDGYVRTSTSQSGFTTEYLYVYYHYYYPTDIKEKKKGLVWDTNEIAAVFLGGNTEAMWDMIRKNKFGDLQEDLYNYQLGYIKNYLQYINTTLVNEGSSFAYDTDYDKTKIKALATQTLYIPDYMKTKSIWGYKDEDREDPNELFKKYPYKYEFITEEALNKKILDGGTEDFYYLMYTKVNGQKIISVTNGKDGDMIYKDYQTMSYQIKTKDLTELASKIKK